MNLKQNPRAAAGDVCLVGAPCARSGPQNTRNLRRCALSAKVIGMLGLTIAFVLGLPFATGGTLVLEEVSPWLMAGTLLVTAVSFGYAVAETSLRDAARLFVLAFLVSWAAEAAGCRWGFPFGLPYAYHQALQPQLWGGVPLLIPLAWYAILRVPVILLRRWKPGRGEPGAGLSAHLGKAAVCGVFMGGCSLMLDPIGVSLGTWTWFDEEKVVGTPLLLNAAGWALVGFVVYAAYLRMQRHENRAEPHWLKQLECEVLAASLFFHGLAFFAIVNRLHTWLPGALAALAMAPLWACWTLTTWRAQTNAAGKTP